MAGGLNKVMLIGHLGSDPEMRYTPNGQAVANFNIATSETWNDKDGGKQEKTEWHKIVTFGKLAELCNNYLKKGRQAYIEGRLQTRQWEDREGNKRYTTEVVARDVVFLGSRNQDGAFNNSYNQAPSSNNNMAEPDFGMPADDEYPF